MPEQQFTKRMADTKIKDDWWQMKNDIQQMIADRWMITEKRLQNIDAIQQMTEDILQLPEVRLVFADINVNHIVVNFYNTNKKKNSQALGQHRLIFVMFKLLNMVLAML